MEIVPPKITPQGLKGNKTPRTYTIYIEDLIKEDSIDQIAIKLRRRND